MLQKIYDGVYSGEIEGYGEWFNCVGERVAGIWKFYELQELYWYRDQYGKFWRNGIKFFIANNTLQILKSKDHSLTRLGLTFEDRKKLTIIKRVFEPGFYAEDINADYKYIEIPHSIKDVEVKVTLTKNILDYTEGAGDWNFCFYLPPLITCEKNGDIQEADFNFEHLPYLVNYIETSGWFKYRKFLKRNNEIIRSYFKNL
jgi:hypothetical protein